VDHVLGLSHPFVSFDIYGADHYNGYYNGYYNWYASPMAYSPPSSSTTCGFLYGIAYDRPCGNPSAPYTVFERGRLADAGLASPYKETNEGTSGLGGGQASSARMLASESIERFGWGDILSARGALPKMAEARAAVLGAGGPSAGPAPEAPPRPAAPAGDPPPPIPGWLKSGAGWWADGMIPDSDLVNGIGFLIDAGVICIGAMPGGGGGQYGQGRHQQGSGAGPSVPGWVKTSAGWWAGGVISDAEFVRGMESPVPEGAMRVGR